MKFYCEYCREQIDSDKDKKCPSCGASYKNNKEYAKLLEEKKEQQKEFNNQVKKVGKIAIIPFILIPIIFISIFIFIVVMAFKSSKNIDNNFDNIRKLSEENINSTNENINREKKIEEVEPVLVNEEKSSTDYKVKLEKYRLLEQKSDKEYDKLEVTLIIEKISDKFEAWGETIYCLVNNASQKYDGFNSDISTYIKDKGIPETKKMTYYVPKNTKSFDIKYGSDIEFHVDIEND